MVKFNINNIVHAYNEGWNDAVEGKDYNNSYVRPILYATQIAYDIGFENYLSIIPNIEFIDNKEILKQTVEVYNIRVKM